MWTMDKIARYFTIPTLARLAVPEPDLYPTPECLNQTPYDQLDEGDQLGVDKLREENQRRVAAWEDAISKKAQELHDIGGDLEEDYENEVIAYYESDDSTSFPRKPQPSDISRKAIAQLSTEIEALNRCLRRTIAFAANYDSPTIANSELGRAADVSHVTVGRWMGDDSVIRDVKQAVYEQAKNIHIDVDDGSLDAARARAWVAPLADHLERDADVDPSKKTGSLILTLEVSLWIKRAFAGAAREAELTSHRPLSVAAAAQEWLAISGEDADIDLSDEQLAAAFREEMAFALSASTYVALVEAAERRGVTLAGAIERAMLHALPRSTVNRRKGGN